MKHDNETIHKLVLTRDIDGLFRTCTAMRRELELKDDLIGRYIAEIDRLKASGMHLAEKYELVESERNLLRRVCRRLEDACNQRNMQEEYRAAWQEYDLTSSGG